MNHIFRLTGLITKVETTNTWSHKYLGSITFEYGNDRCTWFCTVMVTQAAVEKFKGESLLGRCMRLRMMLRKGPHSNTVEYHLLEILGDEPEIPGFIQRRMLQSRIPFGDL